jgi:phosphate transport system permease protein
MELASTKLAVESSRKREYVFDLIFKGATGFFAYAVLLLLALILLSLLWEGHAAFETFGLRFLWTQTWDPVADQYGAFAAVSGTVITSLIAMVLAIPVSFGIALFITELAPPWLKTPLSTAIELLAGIPSVIFGMWGLFIFAPAFAKIEPKISTAVEGIPVLQSLFSGPPMGIGMLCAGIILAIMTVPFISAVMREVFVAVPKLLKESAHALGATTWEVVRSVVLPYAKTGVLGGIFLGLGRALGETMAVTFVIGNAHEISASLFAPGTSISAVLANEFSEATTPLYKSSLLALGFVLFLITFVVLILARLMLRKLTSRQSQIL